MYVLLRPFLRLCLLDSGPQDLPASTVLFAMALMGYTLVSILISMPIYSFGTSVLVGMLDVALLFVFTRVVLMVRSQPERLTQTLCALAGCGALLGLLGLPLVYSIYGTIGADTPVNPVVRFAYMIIVIWSITVYGHIYRQALSTRLWFGLLISFVYIVIANGAIQTLFPLPA